MVTFSISSMGKIITCLNYINTIYVCGQVSKFLSNIILCTDVALYGIGHHVETVIYHGNVSVQKLPQICT